MKRIFHYFKRRFQKAKIKVKKTFDPVAYSSRKLDPTQQKARTICMRLLNDPDSELLYSGPYLDRRYVKNGDYFIIIDESSLKIVNHVYSYDIAFHGSPNTKLKNFFDLKLNGIRLEMEDEIMLNVTHSLDNIIANINSKTKK